MRSRPALVEECRSGTSVLVLVYHTKSKIVLSKPYLCKVFISKIYLNIHEENLLFLKCYLSLFYYVYMFFSLNAASVCSVLGIILHIMEMLVPHMCT